MKIQGRLQGLCLSQSSYIDNIITTASMEYSKQLKNPLVFWYLLLEKCKYYAENSSEIVWGYPDSNIYQGFTQYQEIRTLVSYTETPV